MRSCTYDKKQQQNLSRFFPISIAVNLFGLSKCVHIGYVKYVSSILLLIFWRDILVYPTGTLLLWYGYHCIYFMKYDFASITSLCLGWHVEYTLLLFENALCVYRIIFVMVEYSVSLQLSLKGALLHFLFASMMGFSNHDWDKFTIFVFVCVYCIGISSAQKVSLSEYCNNFVYLVSS